MLKKTITFNDLDGNPVTEDFYFNLSKAELAEMELVKKGGLTSYLQTVIESEDGKGIMDAFKDIIRLSVGRRSEDGRRFIKTQEITDEFMQTDAYSELFLELVTNAEASAAFVKAVVPRDLAESVDVKAAIEGSDVKVTQETVELPQPEQPAWVKENRDPTVTELQGMTPEQLQEAFRKKAAGK